MSALLSIFDWRSIAVFRRDAFVYLRNWKTAFLPPAMEPVVYFLAFGLGLGTYVGSMVYDDRSISYASWIAPGLIAYAAFSTAFFEGLYSSFVRMFYQKTWDGLLATQVELRHIVWGETLWAGARGLMNTAVVGIVLGLFHLFGAIEIHWPLLLVTPLLCCVAGWAFGASALIFTALVPAIDHMNYPVFLIGMPVMMLSNTFFPVESDHPVLHALIVSNPLYHLSETCRSLLINGGLNENFWSLLLSGSVLLIAGYSIALPLMRRRLLGSSAPDRTN